MKGFGDKVEGLLTLWCSGSPEGIEMANFLAQAAKLPVRKLLQAAGFADLGFGSAQKFAESKLVKAKNQQPFSKLLADNLQRLQFVEEWDFSSCSFERFFDLNRFPKLSRLRIANCRGVDLGKPSPYLKSLYYYGSHGEGYEETQDLYFQDYAAACRQLEIINLYGYRRAGLDLQKFANHPQLRTLYVSGYILPVANLDWVQSVETVLLGGNSIEQLEISRPLDCRQLQLGNNKLKQVNLQHFEKVNYLDFSLNELQGIDVSPCRFARSLSLHRNKIERMSVKKLPDLNFLYLDRNPLKRLKLEDLPALCIVSLEGSELEELEISHCHRLTDIRLAEYQRNGHLHKLIQKDYPHINIRWQEHFYPY